MEEFKYALCKQKNTYTRNLLSIVNRPQIL